MKLLGQETIHFHGATISTEGSASVIVLTADKSVVKLDANVGTILATGDIAELTETVWIPQQLPVLSPDGKEVYIGTSTTDDLKHGRALLKTVADLDVTTLKPIRVYTMPHSFWTLTAASVGETVIYAVAPEQADILVIRPGSGPEARSMAGIGVSPIFAMVAR